MFFNNKHNPLQPGDRIRQLKVLKTGQRVHAVWEHTHNTAELIVAPFYANEEYLEGVARRFSFVQPGPSHILLLFDCEVSASWAELYFVG